MYFTKELYHMLEIKIALLIVQLDGQIKYVNQKLSQYLWLIVNEWQSDQYDLLSIVEFQHNNHVYIFTKYCLFLLNIDCLFQIGFKLHCQEFKIESIINFTKQMNLVTRYIMTLLLYQVQFTLEGKSLQNQLGNIQSVETSYKKLSNMDLSE